MSGIIRGVIDVIVRHSRKHKTTSNLSDCSLMSQRNNRVNFTSTNQTTVSLSLHLVHFQFTVTPLINQQKFTRFERVIEQEHESVNPIKPTVCYFFQRSNQFVETSVSNHLGEIRPKIYSGASLGIWDLYFLVFFVFFNVFYCSALKSNSAGLQKRRRRNIVI